MLPRIEQKMYPWKLRRLRSRAGANNWDISWVLYFAKVSYPMILVLKERWFTLIEQFAVASIISIGMCPIVRVCLFIIPLVVFLFQCIWLNHSINRKLSMNGWINKRIPSDCQRHWCGVLNHLLLSMHLAVCQIEKVRSHWCFSSGKGLASRYWAIPFRRAEKVRPPFCLPRRHQIWGKRKFHERLLDEFEIFCLSIGADIEF